MEQAGHPTAPRDPDGWPRIRAELIAAGLLRPRPLVGVFTRFANHTGAPIFRIDESGICAARRRIQRNEQGEH